MRIHTILLTIAGLLLLSLGLIGIFIPILPTTPFVLAAAACLTGTPKLRAKILRIPLFRDYIESYQKGQGLPRKTVIRSLTFLWTTLLVSMLLVRKLWLVCLLIIVGICVTWHILWIAKPKSKEN